MDRSSTPDSLHSQGLVRRGMESGNRWEGKPLVRNVPNLHLTQRPMDPLFKSVRDGSSDDDGVHSGRSNLETLFNPSRPPFRGPPLNTRHQRHRRPSPRDDRSSRFPLKDADFPSLESARGAKRSPTPSSQSETPKGNDKPSHVSGR